MSQLYQSVKVLIDGQAFRLDAISRDALSVSLLSDQAFKAQSETSAFRLESEDLGVIQLNCSLSAQEKGTWSARPVDKVSVRTFKDLQNRLRKDAHIRLCESADVEALGRFTGFERFHFLPLALPELDWSEIDPSSTLFGRRFPLPFLISGMTGGVAQAQTINERLAEAAAHYGIPMGLGSQRLALENPDLAAIFALKRRFPKLFLIGNLGFTQILQAKDPLDLARRAVDMVEADALAIHVNLMQESVQSEGDRGFRGFYRALERLIAGFERPLMIKEVGCGLDPKSAARLANLGVRTLDVGGSGGTNWALIEGLRAGDAMRRRLGETFRNWGIPTAYALRALRRAHPDLELVATGGLRDGLHIAKALALGANMAGIALPFLKAALLSSEAVREKIEELRLGVTIAMLGAGSAALDQLKSALVYGLPLEGIAGADAADAKRGEPSAFRQ